VKVQRLLLEYDDARSGSFEPLRDVPDDKFVVLGLITTKRSELESIDLLTKRVGAASRYVSMERLGLSPQCGFASSIIGNRISFEDQRRKLELVVETARALWK
jgi:5-methyltetrahydropteroyltriglutamate--homocysteine methyltransferase